MKLVRKCFAISAILALSLPIFIAGCADSSKNISASYVSPLKYRTYTCDQLTEEYARVLEESRFINKSQDDTAGNDAVAMGVGLVLFWPALFFIDSSDQKEEVARLKGEIQAVEKAAIRADCKSLAEEMRDARKAAREAAKKAEDTEEK